MSAGLVPPEVQAPPTWRRIDFISDLHLSADTPNTFDAWAQYMRGTPADAVFILGDLFEVWVGDDMRFDDFEAACAQVLAESARRRHVGFMMGNRDFLVGDALLSGCGIHALPDPCVLSAFGQRVLLTHGDELCLDDTEYQQFRKMVRSAGWQHEFLAQPLDARRRYAREVRRQSEMRKRGRPTPADWADVDPAAAWQWMDAAAAPTMIHGHTHRPGRQAWPDGRAREVLSDWDLDHPPHRAEVLRLGEHGLQRLPLSAALAQG